MNGLNEKDYVVLDVETNGLSSTEHDLLSISIFDPITDEFYDRFLPLEMNPFIYTTSINGITEEILKNEKPISQEEFDKLIRDFNLDDRTILTYGNIDKKFIKAYCKRHKLVGFDKLKFFNFKQKIISSGFSFGNITKDNLCKMYNIENIKDIHSGHNDCWLEWQLFKKIYNKFLLIVSNNVFELNDKYIVPVSYLQSYNNFKYYRDIPKVYLKTKVVKKFKLNKQKITRFDTNISGISIEHLINTMIDAKTIDSVEFELKNKNNLTFIGQLPSVSKDIQVFLKNDGTMSTSDKKHEKYIKIVNKTTEQLKKQIEPLIDYLKKNIFNNERILSQELIVDNEQNILCKCDLSNECAVLEIKTGHHLDFEKIKLQLFYEAHDRPVYVLHLDWDKLEIIITKVYFIDEQEFLEIKRNNKIRENTKRFQQKLQNKNLVVLEYINSKFPIKLKCVNCNNVWSCNAKKILNNPVCPNCFPKTVQKKDYTKEFGEKIFLKSNYTLFVLKYYGIRSNTKVKCLTCNNVWVVRADYLLDNCYCPNCRKSNEN